GPFSMVVSQLQQVKTVSFSDDATPAPQPNESSTLTFTVFTDPKLRLSERSQYRLDEAVDDKGNSLLPPPPPVPEGAPAGATTVPTTARWSDFGYSYGGGLRPLMGQLQLRFPPGLGNRLARLKGRLRFFMV